MPEWEATRVRELLADALPEESPPTALDRDTLIAAGRRARRRRRLAVGTSAVVVVALVAGGLAVAATVAVQRSGRTLDPAASAAPASVSPSATTPGTDRAARLSAVLQTQLAGLVPTATFGPGTLAGLRPLEFTLRQHSWYEASATMWDDTGVGGIEVGVVPDGAASMPSSCTGGVDARPDTCYPLTIAGVPVQVHCHAFTTGAWWVEVDGVRSDGTYVWVRTYDYDPTTVPAVKNPSAPARTMPSMPLTDANSALIVVNPELSG